MSITMYTRLYDSMVAWYMRRPAAAPYVQFYVITTLSSMALINIGTLVALSAHWKAAWAASLIDAMKPAYLVLVGGALVAVHWQFSRWRQRVISSQSESNFVAPSKWIAAGYMLGTVIIFLYASTLIPFPHS